MKKAFLIIVPLILALSLLFVFFQKNLNQNVLPNPSTSSNEKNPGEKSEEITLISTGDIGLVRDINYKIRTSSDPNYPFLKIAEYLKSADLTVTNLEGPLVNNCPVILTGFKFCGEDDNVKGMVYAGIDAASLANNHATNFGQDGLNQSVNILSSNGIKPFGVDNKVEYLDVKGKKVAFVGFVELGNNWPGLNNATVQNTKALTAEAKKNADIVIAAFHWGTEYVRKPTKDQIELAHISIDNGADIVLGNHPHWIQDSEVYKGKFITYAQGNTIFDQDWSQETKEGVLYKFVYKDGAFEKVEEKFTIIENNSQPRFATEKEIELIKQKN